MNAALADLLGLGQALLWQGFLVFLRVGPVMALLPAFGEQSVPMRVKLVLALAFSVIVMPAAPVDTWSDPANADQLPIVVNLILAESAAGFIIGIGIRLFVLALQTAGSIAAQATSLSQILGGAGGVPLPAMGHVLVVGGLALAMLTGFHVRVAQLMILSYEALPRGVFPEPKIISDWGVTQISSAFALAFTLAAPFVIISVLYNLTLGVINRAMPQLMVAFVGAPLITAGGLILLFLLSPLMLSVWLDALNSHIAQPFGIR